MTVPYRSVPLPPELRRHFASELIRKPMPRKTACLRKRYRRILLSAALSAFRRTAGFRKFQDATVWKSPAAVLRLCRDGMDGKERDAVLRVCRTEVVWRNRTADRPERLAGLVSAS